MKRRGNTGEIKLRILYIRFTPYKVSAVHRYFFMSCDSNVDASQETRLVVQALKIERLEEKQEELRERLKVVEKWVIGAAAVLAAGVTLIGFATNISKAYL